MSRTPPGWANHLERHRGRYQFPQYNDAWFVESVERSMYRSDIKWVVYKLDHRQPVIGTAVRRRGHRYGEHPEDGWINTRPPEKDENGIPLALPVRGRRPDYGTKRNARMRINGRWHVWDGRRWCRLVPPRGPRPVRYDVPNDLRVQHGPWWPEGRQEVINLQRRIEERKPAPPTDQQAQDIRDLLDALGVS